MYQQDIVGGHGSARQIAAAQELVRFFSSLGDHVHRSWVEFGHPDLMRIALNDTVARRQISKTIALRVGIRRFESVIVPEDSLWCMNQSTALHSQAARLGAHALGRWIQRRVARSEVAYIEKSIGQSTLDEVMCSPVELIASGDLAEFAVQATQQEQFRDCCVAIGWDCMIDLVRSALGRDHAAAWRMLLLAPMKYSTQKMGWQVTYRHPEAMRALNAWSAEGVYA